MSKRSLLTEIFKNHGDAEGAANNTILEVYKALNVQSDVTVDDVLNEIKNKCDKPALKQVIEAMLQGSKKDQKIGLNPACRKQ